MENKQIVNAFASTLPKLQEPTQQKRIVLKNLPTLKK